MVLHHVRSLYEMGQKCKIAYNLAEGLSCYTQAIDEIESLPNPSIGIHRLRCDIYLDICDIYTFRYKWKKANEWKKKGLSLANGLQDEVRIAECLYRQSEVKIRLWNFNGALEDCTKALEMKLKCLDENDVRLADSYHQLGRIYCGQNMCDVALSMHDKSLQIRLLVLGHNHLHVADSYHGIGIVYKKQGKYDLSLSVHDKSLQIRLSVLGYHHPDVALIYNNIGVIYDLQGKYDEALSMYNKSLYIALPVFGENHPNVRRTRNNITRTRHKQQIQYNQSTSMTKKFVDSIAKLFTPNQTYNAATTASNNGTGKNPNLDIFQHVQDEDLQKKIYYNAYNKALNQGHCYNNLIRGMFIGPRNVGKSSIRKVFTQQVLVNNQSPTQVAENSDIMVETESYCIHNLEIYDWTEILDDNVKTVIQELAETSIDSQATINQQIVNIDGIDQLVIPDNLSEQNLQEDDASVNQFHTEETAIPSKEIEIESESKLSLHQYYCSSIINQNIDRRDNNFNQYVKIWDFG
ncbi:Kinesin light chain, partial [Trichoplax sp. H2]